MVKEVVLLWMVAMLGISAQITEVVNDTNKNLASVPSNYSSNITKLILRRNHILMSSSDVRTLRNYSKLTELDLSYNRIETLPADTFSALGDLETLSLVGNILRTLSDETAADLSRLKKLDLSDNPWNCSRRFLKLVRRISTRGVEIGPNATCESPQELVGKTILDMSEETHSTSTTTPLTTEPGNRVVTAGPGSTAVTVNGTIRITTRGPLHVLQSTSSMPNISKKDSLVDAETGEKKPGVTNTWKFLTGVIVIVLCTSAVIVCAIKSPSWYKMIFNYRHKRLREAEEPRIFNSGRYSNFSLDTEQTETSVNELDQDFGGTAEDEDGFIEDGYIQPGDYNGDVDVDEV